MSSKSSSDALSRIRRGRRPSSVEARIDPLTPNSPVQLIPLSKITDRGSDTRAINAEHVEQLVESIRVVGLITPLALDRDYTLLAGAHRLSALKTLALKYETVFQQLFPDGKIPARVMSISADTDQLLALRVEIEENEKRRDYTAAEVLEVAQTLENAGFTRSRGRPSAGQKPLIPALESIFGKSKATIKRYLAQEHSQTETQVLVTPEQHMWGLAQDKCDQISNKIKRIEKDLLRAKNHWENEVEMLDSDSLKHQQLMSALEVSLLHLAKVKSALNVSLKEHP